MTQLKTPRRDDLSFIRRLWSDPETMRPVGGAIELTDEQAQNWFEKTVNPGSVTDYYQLVCDAQGRAVGEVSFHRLDLLSLRADFNMKIAYWERGKGYGGDAVQLFMHAFFNDFGGHELVDDVALVNEGDRALLEKLGFERDPSVEDVYKLRMNRERFDALHNRPKDTG